MILTCDVMFSCLDSDVRLPRRDNEGMDQSVCLCGRESEDVLLVQLLDDSGKYASEIGSGAGRDVSATGILGDIPER